ncbi:MAG: DUF2127 domain-containing protein [Candidatus Dormibacteria bacterium]
MAEKAAPAPARPGPTWVRRLRYDLGMRMEHRGWVIWYLIIEKALQGLLFFGIGVWVLISRHRIPHESLHLIDRFDLDEGRNLVRVAAFTLLKDVATMKSSGIIIFGIGSLLHASLETLESIGLLMRRRWAEYLVVLATGFLIPLEVFELFRRATPFRVSILAFNVLICIYLVRQKQLFQFSRKHDGDHI